MYQEMDQDVLPSMRRKSEAIGSAQLVTLLIPQILQSSEEEATRILGVLVLVGASVDGRIMGGGLQTAWGHVADFFIGM